VSLRLSWSPFSSFSSAFYYKLCLYFLFEGKALLLVTVLIMDIPCHLSRRAFYHKSLNKGGFLFIIVHLRAKNGVINGLEVTFFQDTWHWPKPAELFYIKLRGEVSFYGRFSAGV
jgi:hypothetical protein